MTPPSTPLPPGATTGAPAGAGDDPVTASLARRSVSGSVAGKVSPWSLPANQRAIAPS